MEKASPNANQKSLS
jgi:hypothetical protein